MTYALKLCPEIVSFVNPVGPKFCLKCRSESLDKARAIRVVTYSNNSKSATLAGRKKHCGTSKATNWKSTRKLRDSGIISNIRRWLESIRGNNGRTNRTSSVQISKLGAVGMHTRHVSSLFYTHSIHALRAAGLGKAENAKRESYDSKS
jgi:hypothetical protein